MLNIILTAEDVEDIPNGTINAMTTEGIEVILGPDDFPDPAWAILNAGGKVIVDAEIIGQHSWTEVAVST